MIVKHVSSPVTSGFFGEALATADFGVVLFFVAITDRSRGQFFTYSNKKAQSPAPFCLQAGQSQLNAPPV
jgi:hypothetical protein